MILKITIENYKSFDSREELSMISSSKIQANKSHRMKIKQVNILKNAVIYGANASGKSNLVDILNFIKDTLSGGLPINCSNSFCRNREENKDRESLFELQMTIGDRFYAYGFSAILSKRIITEEWLFELMQDGSAHNLFARVNNAAPTLGDNLNLTDADRNRFCVYADDFAGHDNQLFLTEMSRGKKYDNSSKLVFFPEVYRWIMQNIIILHPNSTLSSTNLYQNEASLERISKLIQTFDTGIKNISTRVITVDELGKIVPREILADLFDSIKQRMQTTSLPEIQMSWRLADGFFNIRIYGNAEPEITTLVLNHGKSFFDFAEESDGTKRLFDLIEMLLTDREDIVYFVDELERSLHPKLTEHFLRLFMDAHDGKRMQLIFTTHEDTIMDQELFRRDEIWFVERDAGNASHIFSLDRFKERYDKKLSKAYLDGRYGAIPVFQQFSFQKEE